MNELSITLAVFWLVGAVFTFVYAALTRFKENTFGYELNEDFGLAVFVSMLWFLTWPWYACSSISPRLSHWRKEGKWK